ncbi:MAG: hypothetical protein DRP45_12425 [Candidatus Zixiibacteriota bacterium]|nr:MAG: hypothetical protein DRP45_12425 [candidate division Zixibacteria bacterium]
MPWVVREKSDGLLRPPEPESPARVERYAAQDPALRQLQQEVETASARELPGENGRLVDTISLRNFVPDQAALEAALS